MSGALDKGSTITETRWVQGVQTFTALVGADVLSVFREGTTWTARIAGQRHEGFESSSAAKEFALRMHKAPDKFIELNGVRYKMLPPLEGLDLDAPSVGRALALGGDDDD